MDYDTWKKYNESTSLVDCHGEEWREIEGYPNYMVSNYGRVKVCERKNYHPTSGFLTLKPQIISHYYGNKSSGRCDMRVDLNNGNGHKKHFLLHRLIASAFIPNPENKSEIDHLNTYPYDNRIENLRWVTSRENSNNPLTLKNISKGQKKRFENKDELRKHTERMRRIADKIRVSRYKKIKVYDANGNLVHSFNSQMEASKITGHHASRISTWCNGKCKCPTGLIWKFCND